MSWVAPLALPQGRGRRVRRERADVAARWSGPLRVLVARRATTTSRPNTRRVCSGGPRPGVLGCGSMATVGRMGDHAASIRIVDIDEGVFDASRAFFGDVNRLGALHNWTFEADDAKHFLATTGEVFDLVVDDIPPARTPAGRAHLHPRVLPPRCARGLGPRGIFSLPTLVPVTSKRRAYGRRILATLGRCLRSGLRAHRGRARRTSSPPGASLALDEDTLRRRDRPPRARRRAHPPAGRGARSGARRFRLSPATTQRTSSMSSGEPSKIRLGAICFAAGVHFAVVQTACSSCWRRTSSSRASSSFIALLFWLVGLLLGLLLGEGRGFGVALAAGLAGYHAAHRLADLGALPPGALRRWSRRASILSGAASGLFFRFIARRYRPIRSPLFHEQRLRPGPAVALRGATHFGGALLAYGPAITAALLALLALALGGAARADRQSSSSRPCPWPCRLWVDFEPGRFAGDGRQEGSSGSTAEGAALDPVSALRSSAAPAPPRGTGGAWPRARRARSRGPSAHRFTRVDVEADDRSVASPRRPMEGSAGPRGSRSPQATPRRRGPQAPRPMRGASAPGPRRSRPGGGRRDVQHAWRRPQARRRRRRRGDGASIGSGTPPPDASACRVGGSAPARSARTSRCMVSASG